MAYENFIAPKKKDGAMIHVAIRKADGTAVEYRIENLQSDKEAFIQDFAATVSAIQKDPAAKKASAQSETEIKYSGIWVRRK